LVYVENEVMGLRHVIGSQIDHNFDVPQPAAGRFNLKNRLDALQVRFT
jgi:hypothetical protein